jgi:hypothetical protein
MLPSLLPNATCLVQLAGRAFPQGVLRVLCRVDPFDADSPIKKMSIEYFPPDMFFVLRVVQLLRVAPPCSLSSVHAGP